MFTLQGCEGWHRLSQICWRCWRKVPHKCALVSVWVDGGLFLSGRLQHNPAAYYRCWPVFCFACCLLPSTSISFCRPRLLLLLLYKCFLVLPLLLWHFLFSIITKRVVVVLLVGMYFIKLSVENATLARNKFVCFFAGLFVCLLNFKWLNDTDVISKSLEA